MNKRNFIKSVVLGIISIPQIIYGDMFSVTEPNGPNVEIVHEFNILTPEEIAKHFIYIKNPPKVKVDADYYENMKKLGWYSYDILWSTGSTVNNDLKIKVIEKIKLYGFKSVHSVRYIKYPGHFGNWYVGVVIGKK